MDPFFCAPHGENISCCSIANSADPDSYECGGFFLHERWWCPSGDCLKDCRDPTALYSVDYMFDVTQSDLPFKLYYFCLNLPSWYRSFKQGRLSPTLGEHEIPGWFPQDIPDVDLKDITSTVTHCLISSCDQARDNQLCTSLCSPSSLLLDATAPSVDGVNQCLSALCNTDGLKGLYYGNSDIVGIGLFSSYITQCVLVLLAWVLFAILGLKDHYKTSKLPTQDTQRENLITGLVELHKQQCFFGISLQIASLFSGIFRVSLLNALTLLPLTTNSVLPLVFSMLLLTRYGRHSTYLLTLTFATWAIASITFWTLYHYLTSLSSAQGGFERGFQAGQARLDFFVELSEISSCGGHSAQVVCPAGQFLPTDIASSALLLSPLTWTWCSVCLACLVIHQSWEISSIWQRIELNTCAILRQFCGHISRFRALPLINQLSKIDMNEALYWVTSTIFLGFFGYQIYLFWTILDLKVVDLHSWGFGQIVAVTAWLPPVIEYIYLQFEGIIDGSRYRFAKSLTITRVSQQGSNPSADSSPPMTLYSLTGSP